MSNYPTEWQKKTIWGALSTLSVVAIGAVAVGLVWLTSQVLGFLQPILIPFAVAAVMAYLLDPVVSKLVQWGTTRQRAVLCVFAIVSISFVGIMLGVIPAASEQGIQLARKLPKLTEDARLVVTRYAHELQQKYNLRIFPEIAEPAAPEAGASAPSAALSVPEVLPEAPTLPEPATAATAHAAGEVAAASHESLLGMLFSKPVRAAAGETPEGDSAFDLQQLLSGNWLRTVLPTVIRNTWNFIRTSVGGFLGVFGFLLSMVIVPIYLYYFLIESRNISESWGDYVPLRASHFKNELIETLEEINGYLIAFFRGQLLVSLINGTATGIGLVLVGLDFGLLIGLLLCFLGLIPYLGIVLCWIPAVIIALVHGSPWFMHGAPWWAFPLIVTLIFFAVQQVDGLFVTPKIVGESVGLHPMTVIVSVFVWSLLMGGLLGAILAVPMTATIKVVLRRYIWERRFMLKGEFPAVTEESFAVTQAQAPVRK